MKYLYILVAPVYLSRFVFGFRSRFKRGTTVYWDIKRYLIGDLANEDLVEFLYRKLAIHKPKLRDQRNTFNQVGVSNQLPLINGPNYYGVSKRS